MMFLVPNIDQMNKEMKKIVEVGNKHGNGDEFCRFFLRVGRKHKYFFWGLKGNTKAEPV
jgi:hypothetical protein